jgi:Serine aminopeptidase, S33
VGVLFAATLAALEAEEAGADRVVLWNPVVKGRAYARELQAIAMTARNAPAEAGDGLESAGFRISGETLAALKAVDLASARFKPGARVLLVDRDDLAADGALAERLAAEGIEHDRLAAPGWNPMMADHQFTVVPDAALGAIVGWIVAHSYARPASTRAPAAPCRRTLELPGLEEALCHFGADGHLFGVFTRPTSEAAAKPAIVMLNAGSIHHVGPHRLYVGLARELALLGHPTLRLDHEGLGDSVLRAAGRENHPYPPTAIEDLRAAMEFLAREHGCERFVVLGLCSGAHTAFHAGRELREAPIERLVLINPWYFYWSEGLSLDTSVNHYENVAGYQRSMKDPERWKKLLRGQVDLARLARVAAAHVAKTVRGRWDDLREMVVPGAGTRLSRHVGEIAAQGRRMNVYVSDGEPAAAILMTEAKRAVRRATRSGALTIESVAGGDHTFSQSAPRADLVGRIRRALAEPPRNP